MFERKRRRAHAMVGLSAFVFFAVSFTSTFVDETIPSEPSERITQAEEFFDGTDWEVRLSTSDGDTFETQNESDDRFINAVGLVAVWQRLGEGSWDMVVWTPTGGEQAVTHDNIEDTQPKTDGRVVVWQRQEDDRWRIVLSDASNVDAGFEQISDRDFNSMRPNISDGRVVWQAWIGNNWEVMLWSAEDGLTRMTVNPEPDLSPDVGANVIVWEGVDPQKKDRDIFAADLLTEEVKILTDNTATDDNPTVEEDGFAGWFTRYEISSLLRVTTDVIQEFSDAVDTTSGAVSTVEEIPTETSQTSTETTEETTTEVSPVADEPSESLEEETSTLDESVDENSVEETTKTDASEEVSEAEPELEPEPSVAEEATE